MQDILDRLDAELATAPASTVDLRAAMASGRRAVRRRRLTVSAAALAAAAAVGGSALALVGDDTARGDDPDVAVSDPSSASSVASAASASPDGTPSSGAEAAEGHPASYDAEGAVVVRDGWRVVEEIANPLGRAEPRRSIGLAITDGTETLWFLLDYHPRGDMVSTFSVSDPALKAFATFREWMADQVAVQGEGAEPEQFVSFGSDGRLVPDPGVEILEQRVGLDLGRGFAQPDRAAAALVEADGERWFVAARRLAGSPPDYFPVNTPLAGTTLESFITYSRAQHASGQGLR